MSEVEVFENKKSSWKKSQKPPSDGQKCLVKHGSTLWIEAHYCDGSNWMEEGFWMQDNQAVYWGQNISMLRKIDGEIWMSSPD